MDNQPNHSGLRQSASASKISSIIDVSQLDKINAIPNKITDNVLMDGLCQEDQFYLNALMDYDDPNHSSGSEDDEHTNPSRQMSSAWSPMAQSPMVMLNSGSNSKRRRMRRSRPAYAITLSLEDISYIRPSWGLSKNLRRNNDSKKRKSIRRRRRRRRRRRIRGRGMSEQSRFNKIMQKFVKKRKDKKRKVANKKSNRRRKIFGLEITNEDDDEYNEAEDEDYDDEEEDEEEEEELEKEEYDDESVKKKTFFTTYHAFLSIIIMLIISLVTLSYYIDSNRYRKHIAENRIKLDKKNKIIEIFRSKNENFLNYENNNKNINNNNNEQQSQQLQRIFRINFGQGIPNNLKGQQCNCQEFEFEANKFNKQQQVMMMNNHQDNGSEIETCFACLDWSMRANLQIKLTRQLQNNANELTSSSSSSSNSILNDNFELESLNCYKIKWQSYDSLTTPLIDCFQLNNDEQWFGLGDYNLLEEEEQQQQFIRPLNKLNFNQTLLITNLNREFQSEQLQTAANGFATNQKFQSSAINENVKMQKAEQLINENYNFNSKLNLGSYVNFTFFTSSGFFLGDLKTDFQPLIWIAQSRRQSSHQQSNSNNNTNNIIKQLCLSVSCDEKCSQFWSKQEQVNLWKYKNNLLEYRVCSATNWRTLVSRQIGQKTRDLALKFVREIKTFSKSTTHTELLHNTVSPSSVVNSSKENAREVNNLESERINNQQPVDIAATKRRGATAIISAPLREQLLPSSTTTGATAAAATVASAASEASAAAAAAAALPASATPIRRQQQSIAEGIGLIDRTIFATSREFMPTLDGQTLRQFVDNIVKLGLKTSPILLVDTRWQMYAGSLRLNSALFPKAKLLFEILHNKGFKIVLTIKPYVDTDLGISYINSLTESNRLYKAAHYHHQHHLPSTPLSRDSVKFIQQQQQQQKQQHDHSVEREDERKINKYYFITRRLAFFKFKNETIWSLEDQMNQNKIPYLYPSKSSASGYFALIDLTMEKNRNWLIEMIKKSNWLTQEADGILFAGAHPDGFQWDDNYRLGLSKLIDDLFYKENLYTIPQWSGNFNYIQLAPRPRTWTGLQSMLESVMNLNALGFALVHPGSVWGDWVERAQVTKQQQQTFNILIGDNQQHEQKQSIDQSEQELAIRWLQISIFLPILQFNDLSLIERFALHELVQNLIKIRKIHVVPEIKKHLPFTPLIGDAKSRQNQAFNFVTEMEQNKEGLRRQQQQARRQQQQLLPVIRHVSYGGSGGESGSETIVREQFFVGTDILVAPIVVEDQRQRDIYLPTGFWHDELKQVNIRGGKWLRNYPVELNEVAWFTRARR